jgi:Holliday junction resolvasome RuvABC endonuclease subunit
VVRYFLRQCGYRWLEPAPTQVKKFVLGKQGEKSQMMLHVFKRWGYEPANDDIADGFGLAAIGLAHAGQLKGLTRPMLEVVGALKLM